MSNFQARLKRLEESIPRRRATRFLSVQEMTDNELAEIIGGPGCVAESLTDAYLSSLVGVET